MEAAEASRYWCHMCSRVVNPVLEIEAVKCPICQGGFIEEMATPGNDGGGASTLDFGAGVGVGVGQGSNDSRTTTSTQWAPILLSMMASHPLLLRRQLMELAVDDDNNNSTDTEPYHDDSQATVTRRRRSSTTVVHLLHPAASLPSESGNSGTDRDRESGDRGRERVIFINPFGQTIIVHGDAYNQPSSEPHNSNRVAALGALGDYYLGPSMDMLLQHLAENDPNRYGTPPAQREAVEALPTVKVEETLQCPVCLDDCETGTEAKEMPCRHRFHVGCILPWLELHSSCPVCRYQLPFDESKLQHPGLEGSTNNTNSSNNEGNQSNNNSNHTSWWFPVTLSWPFASLFSSFTSQPSAAGNTSPSTPSGSSANAPRSDEN